MLLTNLMSYYTTHSFSRRATLPINTFITSNGVANQFISLTLRRWFPKKLVWGIPLTYRNSVAQLWQTRAEFSASAEDIRIICVAIGWWNTLKHAQSSSTSRLCSSNVLTLLHFIQNADWSSLLVATTQKHSIQLVKSMTSRMIRGAELLTLTLQETQLHPVCSITSIFTFSVGEPSLTRRRSLTQSKCMTWTSTCGGWST